MKQIYELFRHGLAHNFYPKSEFNLMNSSTVAIGVDVGRRVVSLSRLKSYVDKYRSQGMVLSPAKGQPYVLVPQVMFLDTVAVMEKLQKTISSDRLMQEHFVKNHDKIRKILRHRM